MTTLYIVLPLALVIGLVSVLAFAWAVHNGQLDDLETPAHRILLDDADHATPASSHSALAICGNGPERSSHEKNVAIGGGQPRVITLRIQATRAEDGVRGSSPNPTTSST